MPLTDLAIKNAKPGPKNFKLYDGGGLFVAIQSTGSKLFRMRYSYENREKLLSFGPYPEVSLAEARRKRDQARSQLREGIDPSAKLALPELDPLTGPDPSRSFEAIAREWHAIKARVWSKIHSAEVLHSLVEDIFPAVGNMDVDSITPVVMLHAIRAIEKREAFETAHRVRQRCSAVFTHAIATGRGNQDPAAIIAKALAPVVKGRQPALTDLEEVRKMLRKVEAEPAYAVTKLAFRMLALTAARPGELRAMEWRELEQLDSAAPIWRVPASKTKMKREHVVPLARQALQVLETAKKISGGQRFVFPSTSGVMWPISQNVMGYMINRAGFKTQHVPHGWRATFSSIMNERYRSDRAVIDLMLAHVGADKVEAAYNRAAYLERRRELAQIWADLLLEDSPTPDLLLSSSETLSRARWAA